MFRLGVIKNLPIFKDQFKVSSENVGDEKRKVPIILVDESLLDFGFLKHE